VSDHYPVELVIQSASGPVRVGAFNVENVGVMKIRKILARTKMGKPEVVDILVKVVATSS